MQTFKNAMKAAKNDKGSMETKLARFLIVYRSTPNTTTGESPAGLLFHRQIRTRLSLITPSIAATVGSKQADQKSHHDKKSKERQFEVNQPVLVENHSGDSRWVPGTILSRLGPMNYEVLVNDKVWKRHVDQILKSCELTGTDEQQLEGDDVIDFELLFPTEEADTTAGQSRYPARSHRPPDRRTYD